MNPQIRRIRPNEWHLLRELRLQALADAPLAFAATLAQEEAFPEKLWRERAVREGLNKALRIGASTEIAVVRDSARVPGLFSLVWVAARTTLSSQGGQTTPHRSAIDAGAP